MVFGRLVKPDDSRHVDTTAARELACDEDEGRWDDALRKVASHRQTPDTEQPE